MEIERVGVVGAGLMGSGIAEVCARAGLSVSVLEVSPEAAERGRARIVASLDRGLRSGKLAEHERDEAIARLAFTTDFAELADRQLVVEAVIEDEALKTNVFRELDRAISDPQAILASNTSSIPIMKLGIATQRPEQVIGIHFFNPVPVLKLVELVTSLLTSPATTERANAFATDVLHKRVIRSQDRAGMIEGCGHPMGPLRLTDLIGLDTTMAVADSLYAEFKEPLYASPPLLSRMVEAGLLGRKTGRGFYDYQAGR